jgi:hypothetical protein
MTPEQEARVKELEATVLKTLAEVECILYEIEHIKAEHRQTLAINGVVQDFLDPRRFK